MSFQKTKLGIVIPVYKKGLTMDEKLSVKSLMNHLVGMGKPPVYFLAPTSLRNLEVEQLIPHGKYIRFHDHFFTSIESYSLLCRSYEFYHRFRNLRYILIFQMDCLLIRDGIHSWTNKGLDYVGAPWFESNFVIGGEPERLYDVGNGGFSLRRVQWFLAACKSCRVWELLDALKKAPGFVIVIRYLQLRLKMVWNMENANFHRYHLGGAEDVFWANQYGQLWQKLKENEKWVVRWLVRLSFKKMRKPTPQEAMNFCIETNPKLLIEKGANPIAIHAWEKYNRIFVLSHAKKMDKLKENQN